MEAKPTQYVLIFLLVGIISQTTAGDLKTLKCFTCSGPSNECNAKNPPKSTDCKAPEGNYPVCFTMYNFPSGGSTTDIRKCSSEKGDTAPTVDSCTKVEDTSGKNKPFYTCNCHTDNCNEKPVEELIKTNKVKVETVQINSKIVNN